MASILAVEDEPTVLVLGESVLQRAGYETLTAGTLAEGQAVIHSDQKLDLVFTDITLPENPEGGLQMGQLVRQARPGVPVLYTSVSSTYRRHERAFCRTQFVFCRNHIPTNNPSVRWPTFCVLKINSAAFVSALGQKRTLR